MTNPTIYETVKRLCKERGCSITQLEKDVGFGNGTIGSWTDSAPNIKSLLRVADYFHVSLDYLAGRFGDDEGVM